MREAPYNFDEIYDGGEFEYQYKVNIDGIEYDQNQLWEIHTSRKVFGEDNPLIGCAMVGQIDLLVKNIGVEINRNASIKPYVRLSSLKRRATTSWIQKGEFFIDTREEDDADDIDLISIRGFDAMRKAYRTYPSSTLRWNENGPSALQVAMEISRHIFGASNRIEPETYEKLESCPYPVGFPAQYTMAEVLGSIAAMYGGNFCISDAGKLMLVSLADLPAETHYLINEKGKYITFGGTRILLRRI